MTSNSFSDWLFWFQISSVSLNEMWHLVVFSCISLFSNHLKEKTWRIFYIFTLVRDINWHERWIICKSAKLTMSKFFTMKNSTTKNNVILPNYLVWDFCGKAQFLHSFGWFVQNYAELWLPTKFPHQKIRWNCGIFPSAGIIDRC